MSSSWGISCLRPEDSLPVSLMLAFVLFVPLSTHYELASPFPPVPNPSLFSPCPDFHHDASPSPRSPGVRGTMTQGVDSDTHRGAATVAVNTMVGTWSYSVCTSFLVCKLGRRWYPPCRIAEFAIR